MKAILKYKLRKGTAKGSDGKTITISSLKTVGARLLTLALPAVYNAPDSESDEEGASTNPADIVVVEWMGEQVTLAGCNALVARINSAEPDWSPSMHDDDGNVIAVDRLVHNSDLLDNTHPGRGTRWHA